MAVRILVGAAWGDEGKGKIVDFLSERADIVVRFQGGANAGHTVQIGDQEYILHLIPVGILRQDKACVIGNGTVIDPEALMEEIEMLGSHGIDVEGRLFISHNAHVIMPYHKLIDRVGEEQLQEEERIGTTGRGIGPAYADKAARKGIRIGDLHDRGVLREKLQRNIDEANRILKAIYRAEPLDADRIIEEYMAFAERIGPFVTNTSEYLNDAIDAGKEILFEGSQGTLLDVDHGTYPYVTSSNTTTGAACMGAGVGPTRIDEVIGVAKAYTTRVGNGPFPTEFPSRWGDEFRRMAGEFGATTGRPRRCGWFDAWWSITPSGNADRPAGARPPRHPGHAPDAETVRGIPAERRGSSPSAQRRERPAPMRARLRGDGGLGPAHRPHPDLGRTAEGSPGIHRAHIGTGEGQSGPHFRRFASRRDHFHVGFRGLARWMSLDGEQA